MTTCPDSGRLRAWIDGEASLESPDEASHAATCAGCLRRRDELQRDATLAAAIISTLAPLDSPDPAAVEAALAAVRDGRSASGPDPAPRRRQRAALSRMVAAPRAG
jgi:hypothetical protein